MVSAGPRRVLARVARAARPRADERVVDHAWTLNRGRGVRPHERDADARHGDDRDQSRQTRSSRANHDGDRASTQRDRDPYRQELHVPGILSRRSGLSAPSGAAIMGAMLGELVGGRFRVERRVGSGAMGTVYRARDEQSQQLVALKILHATAVDGRARFGREVTALARLTHPGVVRYVAHGDGPAFVAMEWLEGEDLAHHLTRGPMPIQEAIDLAARVADAIDHVHALGVVHRDIKPSNLFFEHDDPARVRVVDFGLAWIRGDVSFRSDAGMLVGTPGYMAPEQIRAEEVDARTDVFALACVLYKCLTGRGPFSGGDAVATLAKVLFDEPEPPSKLRPGVPGALDALLAGAMAKERARRPPSARAFAASLRSLEREVSAASVPAPAVSGPALTHRERRIVSVVVAARGGLGPDVSTVQRVEAAFADREDIVRGVAARHGAHLEILPVAIVGVLVGQGAATDDAARAARLSLALREALANVPVALATGHAEIGQRTVGDVIDRAVARVMMQSAEHVAIDDTTTGLLGPSFIVRADATGTALIGERPSDMRVRTLLGKPTPCVGRDRELAFLDATLTECESEEVARCVLVTAGAGIGKSRLRYEWLRRLANRDVEVWTARADPMTSGSPFTLAAQLVRRTAAIDPADPLETARARLRARVSLRVGDGVVAQSAAEFRVRSPGSRFRTMTASSSAPRGVIRSSWPTRSGVRGKPGSAPRPRHVRS